jgi:hypothetical protein
MGFFGRGRQQPTISNKEQVATHVERILQDAGIRLEEARINGVDGLGWKFKQGSAEIEIYINNRNGKEYFQVVSPIMHLPQNGLLAFYRRLLELNLIHANLTFGIFSDVVYVFNERPLDGLDLAEARDIIAGVALNADSYDNLLVNEFGGRIYNGV